MSAGRCVARAITGYLVRRTRDGRTALLIELALHTPRGHQSVTTILEAQRTMLVEHVAQLATMTAITDQGDCASRP